MTTEQVQKIVGMSVTLVAGRDRDGLRDFALLLLELADSERRIVAALEDLAAKADALAEAIVEGPRS